MLKWKVIHLYLHLQNQTTLFMPLMSDAGSLSIRRNTCMRSLFIEYPRLDEKVKVLADLFNLQQVNLKVNLPILSADKDGIALEWPATLNGVFYIKIQDGNQSILKRIAIQ